MPGRNNQMRKQAIKEIKGIQKSSERVLQRVISDVRSRAPGWVAADVVEVYNIKKAEIVPAKAGKATKSAGSVKVTGETVDSLALVYRGRPLTLTHFGARPEAPKPAYTLSWEIIKGQKHKSKIKKLTKKQRRALGKNFTRQGTRTSDHSPIMLMHTGAKSADKTQYIPFQRKSTNRKDIEAIKTVSLPQMVGNETVSSAIQQTLNENIGKRMAQHMKLLQK